MRRLRQFCLQTGLQARPKLNSVVAIGCLCLVVAYGSATTGQAPGPQIDLGRLDELNTGNQPLPTPPQMVPMVTDGHLLAFASTDGAGGQLLTLVDTQRLSLVVYQITKDGVSHIRSARQIAQDFKINLNVTDPTPTAINQLNPIP